MKCERDSLFRYGIVDLNLSMSPTCILDEWAGQAAYLSCVEKVNAELSAKIRK